MQGSKTPIFVYHDVDRTSFQEEMEFLCKNAYRTLSAEDLFNTGVHKTSKDICLTFDDCRIDCFTNAHTYLKKYSYKAIMFVCPRFIYSDNVSSRYCSWENLKCMAQEETADIQNHSMEHELVFTSANLIDFERPYSDGKALYPDFSPGRKTFEWGTPIYEYKWKGATDIEYMPGSEVSSRCIEFVKKQGGVEFFKDKSWKKRITKVYESVSSGSNGRTVKIDFERESFVRKSLRDSQEEILRKTGAVPRFFAPPVHSYDSLVIKVLKEEGFKGLFDGSGITYADEDGFIIFGRKRHGSPMWLPGKGRRGLTGRLLNFIKRQRFWE